MSRPARRIGALLSVLGLTTATVLVAGPAQAGTAPSNCTTIKQLGPTAYITSGTFTIASVKQFYGTCGGYQRNWSYVWLWDQAFTRYDMYVGRTGISTDTSEYGERSGGMNQQEVKSYPANTAYLCTQAYASVELFDKGSGWELGSRSAQTAKVC
jgi:hypothetical protein